MAGVDYNTLRRLLQRVKVLGFANYKILNQFERPNVEILAAPIEADKSAVISD